MLAGILATATRALAAGGITALAPRCAAAAAAAMRKTRGLRGRALALAWAGQAAGGGSAHLARGAVAVWRVPLCYARTCASFGLGWALAAALLVGALRALARRGAPSERLLAAAAPPVRREGFNSASQLYKRLHATCCELPSAAAAPPVRRSSSATVEHPLHARLAHTLCAQWGSLSARLHAPRSSIPPAAANPVWSRSEDSCMCGAGTRAKGRGCRLRCLATCSDTTQVIQARASQVSTSSRCSECVVGGAATVGPPQVPHVHAAAPQPRTLQLHLAAAVVVMKQGLTAQVLLSVAALWLMGGSIWAWLAGRLAWVCLVAAWLCCKGSDSVDPIVAAAGGVVAQLSLALCVPLLNGMVPFLGASLHAVVLPLLLAAAALAMGSMRSHYQ